MDDLRGKVAVVTGGVIGKGDAWRGPIGQTWSERLGDEPPPPQSPMIQLMDAALAQGIEAGIDPADVATQVVDAIRTERFWILTHPETRQIPVERMQRAAAQENPA